MNIRILLPYKEMFSSSKASAVSLSVKNSIRHSKFFKQIKVYGRKVENPFFEKNFEGLSTNWIFHLGHNKSLAYSFYKKMKFDDNEKKIIELHNRPYIFNYLKKRLPFIPITLHFHNDPTTMKGSKTVQERKSIIKNASAIYCVSDYIKKRFQENIHDEYENLYVLNNGIERNFKLKPIKKKEVLFVGRLVQEKGAHIFVNSLTKIINTHKDWTFNMIGTSKAGQSHLITDYENKVVKQFRSLGSNAKYLGFVNNELVQEKMKTASIVVVPSLWPDPYPLVAIEAICNGAAIISSDLGGLPEIVKNIGVMINNIDEEKLSAIIHKLLSDKKLLEQYTSKSWNNYKFDIVKISQMQDSIRTEIIKDFYNSKK